jgi:hypothetical protein
MHVCNWEATNWRDKSGIPKWQNKDDAKSCNMPKGINLAPVCHNTYDDFKKQMDNALWYVSEGFHLV